MRKLMALILLALFASAVQADSLMVTKEEYGAKWAFKFNRGILSCERYAVFIADVDTLVKYPLNGPAISAMENGRVLAQPLENVWLPNPKNPGAKINVGPYIDAGLKLCKKK